MQGFIDFEYNNIKGIKENEIIQIGLVVMDDNCKVAGQFSSFVKLKKTHLGNFISNMTGITQQDIETADDFKTVSAKFLTFTEQYHDLTFYCWGNSDEAALKDTCKINDCYIMLDTIKHINNIQTTICKSIFYNNGNIRSRISQSKICEFYGIVKREEHNAFNDALTLADIYKEWKTRGDFIYPTGFEKNNVGKEIACRVVEEMTQNDDAEICYKTDEERAQSLIDFIDGEKEIKKVLNRRVFDTCKKYFDKKSTLLKDEINVNDIDYDSLEHYTLSINIKNDSAILTISDGVLLSSIDIRTTRKNRKHIKSILKKMKEIAVA